MADINFRPVIEYRMKRATMAIDASIAANLKRAAMTESWQTAISNFAETNRLYSFVMLRRFTRAKES